MIGLERERILHVGVYGNSGKQLRLYRDACLNQHVLKAENGKFRFVGVETVLAGILELLKRFVMFLARVNISLGKFSVLQQLTEIQGKGVSRVCSQIKG